MRKTNTPRWLSITRKIMIYLGGSTFILMLFSKIGIKDVEFALQSYLSVLGVVQIIIDAFYRTPKEKDIYKQ